jgi:RNA polymerase sigma-70 factor (ECF subfamily)
MNLEKTSKIQNCLNLLKNNAPNAKSVLLEATYDRFLSMLRPMLARFPRLRRWVQSQDILQNVQIRLMRCLNDVQVESVAHLFALAATNMRRELIDQNRKFFGELGDGTNLATPDMDSDGKGPPEHGQTRENPLELAQWLELHETIAKLPERELEVFQLVWYQGLEQQDVADLLNVSLKTVKRRWMSAKTILATTLKVYSLEHNGIDPLETHSSHSSNGDEYIP